MSVPAQASAPTTRLHNVAEWLSVVAIVPKHGLLRANVFTSVQASLEAALELPSILEYVEWLPTSHKGQTDLHGVAEFQVEIPTSSSNRHPKPRAFPSRCWVMVTATGYGGVIIPLGQEPVLTSELREQGGFLEVRSATAICHVASSRKSAHVRYSKEQDGSTTHRSCSAECSHRNTP